MAKQFTISVPEAKVTQLQARLKATHFSDSLVDGWGYGADASYMKSLMNYWQKDFNWQKAEAELNAFAHFTASVEGVDMHFIHQRSSNPHATPLLLIHGWPDSFYRFYKVIPELAKDFHVIVPSLPGFGFSEKVAMNSSQTADVLAALMHKELEYKKFAVSGGDIGMPIVRALAAQHASLVSAVHLTDTGYPMGAEDFSTMSPAEQEFAGKCQQWWYTEGAYNMLQSTKPQTLAYALADSPVGLAAWMVEKFQAWSDGGIEDAFTKDEILTNICIYYFTDTIATSMRTYAENTRAQYASGKPASPAKMTIPTAITSFPGEMVPVVKEWAARQANVVRFTSMDKGGHFAALEVPELFAKDLSKGVSEIIAK